MNELLVLIRILLLLAVLGGAAFLVWRRYGSRLARPLERQEPARICPQLGLAADPFSHSSRPDEEHRCYANLARERIDLGHQQRFCLASTHKRCPFLAVAPREEGVTARARTWWRTVSPAAGSAAIGLQPRLRARLETMAASLLLAVQARVAAWREQRAAVAELAPVAEVATMPAVEMTVAEVAEPVRVVAEEEPVAVQPAWAEALKVAATHAVEAPEEIAPAHAMLLSASEPQPEPEPELELQPEPEPVRGDLVAAGVKALEAGDEQVAYELFKKATKANKHDARAWYWRAKTAETLDEVIDCLSKAEALEPDNAQIAANLAHAQGRKQDREQAPKATPIAKPKDVKEQIRSGAGGNTWMPRRPSLAQKGLRVVLDMARTQAALAAFAIGAVWLLTAMPPELRDQLLSMAKLSWLKLPETARLTELVHLSIGSGYDIGTALPFAVGFLSIFVGMGLISDEGWTRFWAPLVGVGTSWVWAASPAAQMTPLLLPACGVMVLGAIVSSDWKMVRRRLSPA